MFNGKFSGNLEDVETIKPNFCILASKNRVKDVTKGSSTDAFMGRNKM